MDTPRTVLAGVAAAILLLALLAPSWPPRTSGNWVSASPDGWTYLQVARTRCFAGVDGEPAMATDSLIPVRPGVRTIECAEGRTREVVIEEGTVFHFAGCSCPSEW